MTHKPKGTGLGLAIVKKIMEDHGGQLTLDDRPDGPGDSGAVASSGHPLPAPTVARPETVRAGYRHVPAIIRGGMLTRMPHGA